MRLALRDSPAVAHALREELDLNGLALHGLEAHRESAWASITFSGTRHQLRYRFTGEPDVQRAIAFMDPIPSFRPIRGQLVADARVTLCEEQIRGDDVTLLLELELLLLEDA